MTNLAARRRKLAELMEEEDDRDQGVNHNLPAILLRDAEEMERMDRELEIADEAADALTDEVERLEADLRGETANSALLERVLELRGRENYRVPYIQQTEKLRATEKWKWRYRAALEELVGEVNEILEGPESLRLAVLGAELLLHPEEFEEGAE